MTKLGDPQQALLNKAGGGRIGGMRVRLDRRTRSLDNFATSSKGNPKAKARGRGREKGKGPRRPVHVRALPHFSEDAVQVLRHSLDHAGALRHSLSLALEPLYMPCSGLKCGDMVYRSTLDPALRLEERGINPYAVGLAGLAATYLLVQPGIFPGFIDYYFLAPLFGVFRRKVRAEDISMGRKIGSGGFGEVFKAQLNLGAGTPTDTKGKGKKREMDIVVKKAYEYGEAEAWMNERLQRVCPNRIAQYVDAFDGPEEKKGAPLWLVWKFEGEGTLADAINDRSFPENLEEKLFGKKLDKSLSTSRRQALVIRTLLKLILDSLNDIHSTGIVHRDVKPQNILLTPASASKLKLIDFGAAADLRIGINYLPKEFLLDPRYAPPEKYIMSTSTPKAPPTPVAALLSPVLWNLNRPDRFDMYSVGILLVQMCFPALRKDNQLVAFNRTLEKLDYDILKWRDMISGKRLGGDYSTGIKILDLDNGRGWDLLRLLISNNPSKRIGARAASSHPFVSNNGLGVLPVLLDQVGEILPEDVQRQSEWLADKMTGTTRIGVDGLTEAMVEDFRNKNRSSSSRSSSSSSNVDVNAYDPNNSRTISWWQARAGGNRKQRRSLGRLFQIWSYKTTKTINSQSNRSSSPSFFNLFNFQKKSKYVTK